MGFFFFVFRFATKTIYIMRRDEETVRFRS